MPSHRRSTRRAPLAAALVVFLSAATVSAVASWPAAATTTSSPVAAGVSGQVRVTGPAYAAERRSVLKELRGRELPLSRDSSRQALRDATSEQVTDAGVAQARQDDSGLAKLAAKAEQGAAELAANGWGLPIPPGSYRLTARFGECSPLWSHCHTGLDFAAPTGTPIHAVAKGVITSVGWAGAYGNRTVETLEDGTELWYCHQSAIGVRTGQHVRTGEQVGLVGATGNVTGPHVHLEVRPGAGDPVDPFTALMVHGAAP